MISPTEFLLSISGFLERIAITIRARGIGRWRVGRWLADLLFYPGDIRKTARDFRHYHQRKPDLLRPKTFSGYMMRDKLLSRNARHIIYADKILSKRIAEDRCGDKIYIPRLLWTGSDLRSARSAALPDKFIIKPNHTSGDIRVVRDSSSFDWNEAAEQADKWLQRDFSQKFIEWFYRWIPPRLLIEEFFEGPDGKVPLDYKFFCFHGRVHFIQVDFDRGINHSRAFFDREFNMVPLYFGFPHLTKRYEGKSEKPENFNDMIEVAELISYGEPFVRVDLYAGKKPIFGEITMQPEAGLAQFDPPDWDYMFGSLIGART